MEDQGSSKSVSEDTRGETLEPFEFSPVCFETQEMRFLVLSPHHGKLGAPLECVFSCEPLESCLPYTYVVNSRGNPVFWPTLSINGFGKPVTVNIMAFLKHMRHEKSMIRLWMRDCCVNHLDAAEKSRYWNPEWMQTMSDHASSVIDLSATMADLWDKGELPRPFPPRPKSWSELREPVPPKHFPMPIGSWRGWDVPLTLLEHLPLDYVTDEIRLVQLLPAQDRSSRLEGLLAYTPMHDGTTYYSLSYTWGSGEASEEIILNGQIFSIRKNLSNCLRAIRTNKHSCVLWIDAICIDQNSLVEKNRQLPRMFEIYETAEVVLSWVGEADDASRTALEFLKGDDLKTPGRVWKVKDIQNFPKNLAALYRFLTRPYFRRAWVIQELAASTKPDMKCGEDVVGWSDVDQASFHLIDILQRDRSMAAQMMKADPLLAIVSDLDLYFVRRLSYFRHLQVKGEDNHLFKNQFAQIRDDSPGILDAVVLARDFESTSHHDKIFAVWNLAQDTNDMEFTRDYSKSVSQSYLEFAVAVMKKNRSLDIICAAEPMNRAGLDLPSWCPDWSTPSTVSCMVRRDLVPNISMMGVRDLSGPIYHAAGRFDLIPRFNLNGITLECTGAVYDSIRYLGPYEANFHNNFDVFLGWLSIIHHEFGIESEFDPSNEELVKSFWSMLAGDVTGVWGVEEVDREKGQFKTVCLKEQETRYQDFWTPSFARRSVTRGRRLMITTNNFMGLAPWYAEENQELAILSGCSAPVLLQENDDGTHRFVGSCFVQGWMEGEMLEFYGSTEEEAWDNIETQGRLKIV